MAQIAELIKYEGDNSTFIWKHPLEDFSSLTQLIVHESQEAIFFMNGQALDLFGPGRYTLETQNIPKIGKVFNRIAGSGDTTPFHCEVYFINKTVQMGLKWGTDSKITYAAHIVKADETCAKRKADWLAEQEAAYQKALTAMRAAKKAQDYRTAAEMFSIMGKYKDSGDYFVKCRKKADDVENTKQLITAAVCQFILIVFSAECCVHTFRFCVLLTDIVHLFIHSPYKLLSPQIAPVCRSHCSADRFVSFGILSEKSDHGWILFRIE